MTNKNMIVFILVLIAPFKINTLPIGIERLEECRVNKFQIIELVCAYKGGATHYKKVDAKTVFTKFETNYLVLTSSKNYKHLKTRYRERSLKTRTRAFPPIFNLHCRPKSNIKLSLQKQTKKLVTKPPQSIQNRSPIYN